MALIKCPECQADVSDKAPGCPHCGTPIKSRARGCLRFFIGGAVVLALLRVVGGDGGDLLPTVSDESSFVARHEYFEWPPDLVHTLWCDDDAPTDGTDRVSCRGVIVNVGERQFEDLQIVVDLVAWPEPDEIDDETISDYGTLLHSSKWPLAYNPGPGDVVELDLKAPWVLHDNALFSFEERGAQVPASDAIVASGQPRSPTPGDDIHLPDAYHQILARVLEKD